MNTLVGERAAANAHVVLLLAGLDARGRRCVLRRSAFVSVVKTTDLRNRDHRSLAGRGALARHRRILIKREMRS